MQAEPATTAPRQWPAKLRLRFAKRHSKTVLAQREHSGPLRVQRPFYPEAHEVCHVYILHPPGGIVSGDTLHIEAQVESGAWALLTTPGAGKFYRNDGRRPVFQQHHLSIEAGATLEWLPQESILYDGVQADLLTRVELRQHARFMGWEISCLGRPASNAPLLQCNVRQRFEIWRNGQPIWLERNRYDNNSPAFHAPWGLRGHTTVGTLVCTNTAPEVKDALTQQLPRTDDSLIAVSQLDEVLVCRYLGNHAQEAREKLGLAWQVLRQLVFGRDATAPRIWNT